MEKQVYSIEDIKQKLHAFLLDKPVKKVILFGSYAKENATNDSDIDLVVDTDGVLKGFDFIKLVCGLEEIFGKEIDCFEQYEIIPNSVVDFEIKNTGVVVYEG